MSMPAHMISLGQRRLGDDHEEEQEDEDDDCG